MGAASKLGKRLDRNSRTDMAFPTHLLVVSTEGGTDMVRKIFLAAGIAAFSLAAAACNTVKGVGQDIESVGEAGDEAI